MITVKEHQVPNFSSAVAHGLGKNISAAAQEYLPLPDVKKKEQIQLAKDGCQHKQAVPFKIENSSAHGFCCGHCGAVLQWG